MSTDVHAALRSLPFLHLDHIDLAVLARRPRGLRALALRGQFVGHRRLAGDRLVLARGPGALGLDQAGQLVLTVEAHQRVLLRDRGAGVAGDLARLDAAAADLLPPRDVGAPERVRSKAGEVEARIVLVRSLRLDRPRGLLQRLPDAGIPPGQREILVLREDPIVWTLALQARDPLGVARRQPAQRQRPLALGRLGHVDVATAVALLDFDDALACSK